MPVCARVLLLIVATAAARLSAQEPPAKTVTFEVASVKPNTSGSGSSSSNDSPGRYVATNMALRRLIAIAHRIQLPIDRDRIVGPSWIDTERFDITARTPEQTPADSIPDMLRALLVDRFKFVAHTETRDETVYALVLTRRDGHLGPQLTVSSLDCSKPGAFLTSQGGGAGAAAPAATAQTPQCGLITHVDGKGGVMRGGARTMADLARNLTGRVNRPVIDRTGLTGTYDFVLQWMPDDSPSALAKADPANSSAASGAAIFTALQEQLGLKLDAQRGRVEFLIVDRVERPSPD